MSFQSDAQNAVKIAFQPKFKGENLALNKVYYFKNDTLNISNFKCYISNLTYYKNDSIVHASVKKAHLIDAKDSSTFVISENVFFKYDEIRFNIGVDSLTNVSGIFEGDLDPANGMYWTWQSGYINFKLEGTSSLSPARKNKFYWHIGGYSPPFNTLRQVALKANGKVSIQLEKLFEEIEILEDYQVMSPNDDAVQIADKLVFLFNTTH
ncbi:MAG: hypothetical protein CL842_03985 [Crocinitomicaceae bacterium]|nr:hypothetical protein [Crocinitomicaceae bacterium]